MTADTQRDAVYEWEGQWRDWNRSTMSLKKCAEVVSGACKKYGVPAPRVTSHTGKAFSFSQGNKISFNHDQKNAAIALHEAAHRICDFYFGDLMDHHSQEWMGIYLWLLYDHRMAPRDALRQSAQAMDIKWVPPYSVSPNRLKKKKAA